MAIASGESLPSRRQARSCAVSDNVEKPLTAKRHSVGRGRGSDRQRRRNDPDTGIGDASAAFLFRPVALPWVIVIALAMTAIVATIPVR